MNQTTLAVVFSSVSIGLSFCAFVWTIVEKLFIRPITRTTAAFAYLLMDNAELGETYISLSMVNKGPGKVQVSNVVVKKRWTWERMVSKDIKCKVWRNEDIPLNKDFPYDLEQYDTITDYYRFTETCILSEDLVRLGFVDTLNRYHWNSRKSMRRLNKSYRERYGSIPQEPAGEPV